MKASCALVCLALAHGITASIIKQQERRVEGLEGLDVQQLDIPDHRQLLRDQPADGQLKELTLQSQKHRIKQQKNQKYRNQLVEDERSQLKYQSQPIQDETNQPLVDDERNQLKNLKYRNQLVQDERKQLKNQKYRSQPVQDETNQPLVEDEGNQLKNQKYRNHLVQDETNQLKNQKYRSQLGDDETNELKNRKYQSQLVQDETNQQNNQKYRQYRSQPVEDETNQPLYQDEINQLMNQKYRSQLVQDETNQPLVEDERNQLKNQKYRNQLVQDETNQPLVEDKRNQLKNQKYRNQLVQDEANQLENQRQEQLPQTLQYQQRLPTYQQYQQSLPLNSQEWPVTHQHSHHSHHHDKHHHHSSSSEESKERNYYNQQVTRDDNQKWTPLIKSIMDKDNLDNLNIDNQKRMPLIKSIMNKDNLDNLNIDNQKRTPLIKSIMDEDNLDNLNIPLNDKVIEWNGLRVTVGPNSPIQTSDDMEKIFGDAHKTMEHVEEEKIVKFNEVMEATKQENNEDAHLNATQLAKKYGYPIEEHIVKTDDGYILTVFRIPAKKQSSDVVKTSPVVFLMHGLLGSADDWMLMGPGKSLAYLLSDAGYDVWLGNARGNKYSRRHMTRWPAMSDFWQFSIDQIALHDLPAMIDLALETTKQEKLHYIGHALGTTAFFALTATRPEYNNKIIMMHALSPMVYMKNARSPLMRLISPTFKFHEHFLRQIGNEGFFPSKELIRTIGGALCENEIGNRMVCSNVNFVVSGINVENMNSSIIPVVVGHLPAGTSAKVIEQYGQGVASEEFRRFDYGPYINMQAYGTPTAPKYNLTEVTAPVALVSSTEDWLADSIDVVRLQLELPNVKEAFVVPDEHFSHMDFQFSSKAPEMVYQHILESMKSMETVAELTVTN